MSQVERRGEANVIFFSEIRNRIIVLLHFLGYLVDSIANKNDKVEHEQRPENINFDGFEHGTDYPQKKRKGYSFPDLRFTHG